MLNYVIQVIWHCSLKPLIQMFCLMSKHVYRRDNPIPRVYNKKSVEPPIPAYKHCVESNVTSGALHVRKRCKISRNFLVYLSVTYRPFAK